jgi:hypothetical protein
MAPPQRTWRTDLDGYKGRLRTSSASLEHSFPRRRVNRYKNHGYGATGVLFLPGHPGPTRLELALYVLIKGTDRKMSGAKLTVGPESTLSTVLGVMGLLVGTAVASLLFIKPGPESEPLTTSPFRRNGWWLDPRQCVSIGIVSPRASNGEAQAGRGERIDGHTAGMRDSSNERSNGDLTPVVQELGNDLNIKFSRSDFIACAGQRIRLAMKDCSAGLKDPPCYQALPLAHTFASGGFGSINAGGAIVATSFWRRGAR